MTSRIILAVVALVCAVGAARAETDCPRWGKAQAVLEAVISDIKADGLRAVRGHVGDMEAALADMDKPCTPDQPQADVVVLADGMMDEMVALAAAQKAYPGKKIVAVADPYTLIALFLGSYYNDVHRYDDGLRVLERERAMTHGDLGETRAKLSSERAVALGQLHRLPEALDLYDAGLKLAVLDDKDKARLLRGRGFVLTELDRLDEAVAAYRESLKYEPGNYVAEHELDYILKLTLGGNKAPASAPVLPSSRPKTN